jgi:hypothetical protein
MAREIRCGNHAFQVNVDECVHVLHGQYRVVIVAGFVEVCALGAAGVGEDEVGALVLYKCSLEDLGEGGFISDVAGVECGVSKGWARRIEVEDVDCPVWTGGEGGCEGEALAGCWVVLVYVILLAVLAFREAVL